MDDQPSKTPSSNQKKPGGYGKKPLWLWVILYVIVGAIVYGLIYYLFFRGNTDSGY